LKITLFDKLRIITNCCPNHKKKKFFEKGDEKLDEELDLVHILTLLKKLEKLVHDPLLIENAMDLDLDEIDDDKKDKRKRVSKVPVSYCNTHHQDDNCNEDDEKLSH
jgi:hypothetical protein